MAGVDFWSPMSTAKLLGNVWHGSHCDVQAPFQAKCLRNHFVHLILPSPLAWERPNNYSFGEVAHLEWHLHLRAYDVWLFYTFLAQSQNLMPPGHNRVAATPKGRWTLTQWGSTMQKNASVSEDCGKNQYWTWLTAWRHPNCYWICCKHLQTFLHSQKGRKKHIILSCGSLNCLARCCCRSWSFPRSSEIPLRSGNGPNWPIECDKLCTSWHS